MPRFHELLVEVMKRKGYAVELTRHVTGASGADYEVPLHASHASGDVFVLWKLDGPVTAEEIQAMAFCVADAKAAGAVLAAPHGANASPGPGQRIEVWTLPRLAAEVGDALVHAALSEEPATAPVVTAAPAVAQPVPAAPAMTATPMPSAPAPAARGPPRKFPSLVAQAAGAASAGGDVYYYKTKPKEESTSAHSDGKPLGYAWGGAPPGVKSDPGIAQVRSGRKQAPAAGTTGTASNMVANPDAEIVGGTKVKRPMSAEVAANVASFVPQAPSSSVAAPGGWSELASAQKASRPAPAPSHAAAAAPPPPPTPARAARDRPAPAPLPAAPAWQGPPAPPNTVAVRLSREDATRAVASRVGTVKEVRLTLHPVIAFDYDAFVDHEQLPEPIAGRGAIYVDALTGKTRDTQPVVFGGTLPEAAEPPAPAKLSAVDIYDKVKGVLGKQFSREMKVARTIGESEVYENLKISPGIDDLGLEHRGVLNAPVWIVSGDKGSVQVDATTGAVLS